jgi:hypothetical protein
VAQHVRGHPTIAAECLAHELVEDSRLEVLVFERPPHAIREEQRAITENVGSHRLEHLPKPGVKLQIQSDTLS